MILNDNSECIFPGCDSYVTNVYPPIADDSLQDGTTPVGNLLNSAICLDCSDGFGEYGITCLPCMSTDGDWNYCTDCTFKDDGTLNDCTACTSFSDLTKMSSGSIPLHQCDPKIPSHCLDMDFEDGYCVQCEDTYSWDFEAAKCSPCMINKCNQCTFNYGCPSCIECASGYVFDWEYSWFENTIYENHYYGSAEKIDDLAQNTLFSCYNPIGQDWNQIQICNWPSPVEFCLVSDLNDQTLCIECDDEHFFNETSKTCELCANAIPGCLECSHTGWFCEQCYDGWAYNWTTNGCFETFCKDPVNILDIYTLCNECNTGYFLLVDTWECVATCPTGYSTIPNDPNNFCWLNTCSATESATIVLTPGTNSGYTMICEECTVIDSYSTYSCSPNYTNSHYETYPVTCFPNAAIVAVPTVGNKCNITTGC